ncbi:MAG: hypothetical protein KDA85_20300, partial [Planctomycetaceae bacterium]|nr:hypothetical protein [Planctomycetaceae bacterium]
MLCLRAEAKCHVRSVIPCVLHRWGMPWLVGIALITVVAEPLCSAEPVPGPADEAVHIEQIPGLRLWLDAAATESPGSVNKSADQASPQPVPVSSWKSRASSSVSVTQPKAEFQPQRWQLPGGAFLRFDGEDDCLRLTQTGLSTESLTVFLVAAPHGNPGEFRGLFAANAKEQRDYQSGLTIDLGPGPTRCFDQLNVEGAGFAGAQDLL